MHTPRDTDTVDLTRIPAIAWNAVARGPPTPMQRHSWVRACAETLAPEGVLLALVGPPDHPSALAPLSRCAGDRSTLELLGAEELWESAEVLYSDRAAMEALARELARLGRPIRFGHYPADSPFIPALRRASRGRGLVVTRELPDRAMPTLALDPSWVEPESHLGPRRRADLRRARRRAERRGEVTVEVLVPRPETLGVSLDEAFEIERSGWKGTAGTAIAEDARLCRFFRRFAELACDEGTLRICFLRIEGRAAATQIALEQDDRFWLLKIGYDEEFRRSSPGNLLIRETIRYAAERGLRSYEFLGKESDWTRVWTTEARPVVSLRWYPACWSGFVTLARDGATALRGRFTRRTAEAASGPSGGGPDA